MPIYSEWSIDTANKIISHDSGTTIYSVRNLYTWLMDQLDESTTVDDKIPMTAQTPYDFIITNGWFLSDTSAKFLKTGGIKTESWSGDIYTLTFDTYPSNLDPTDIGRVLTTGGGAHTGIILGYTDSTKTIWVRKGTSTFANSDSCTITGGTAGTYIIASSNGVATGDAIWANIYSLGTIQNNTDIYVVKNFTKITSWWTTGHIDLLVKVKEAGTLIDYGLLTALARQYTKLYDHYTIDVSLGSRNAVPLSTSKDLNNTTGYSTVNFNNGNLGFTLAKDDVVSVGGVVRAVVTAVTSGGSASGSFEYYLVNTLTDFTNAEAFTASPSGKTGNINGSPADFGPALLTGITFTFGATSKDIDDGNGPQPYDLIIDGNSKTVKEVYERTKYLSRRASTESLNGHDGEQYLATGYIKLNMQTDGGFTQGLTITGGSSSATGVIVGNHAANPYFLVVRDVRGTFANDETVIDTGSGTASTATSGAVETIEPSKTAPFATFAGGRFFGARGVWLQSVSDANNFELIDSNGTPRTPPATISLSVDGLESGDRVGLFRAVDANGAVNKSMFTIDTPQTIGSSTITIVETIPADTPAKTGPTGYLRVVRRDGSGNIINEQRYTYESWSGSTFTLLSGTTTSYAYDTTDTVYVPYIDEQATSTSISKNVTYASPDKDVVLRVRKKGILPFEQKGKQITSSGFSATATRTTDSVVV